MYEKGQRVVVRTENSDEVAIVEEIIVSEQGQRLRVKDPTTGATKVVNPITDDIVEQLED